MNARLVTGLVVLAALLAVGAYWIGPGVVPRARLELLALGTDSRFARDVRLGAPSNDTWPARYPIILAVRNVGERVTSARSLSLSLPGWVRLEDTDGPVRTLADEGDEPLHRYGFPLGGEPIEAGALPQVPAGLEQMWLTAELPAMTCRLRWDGVPEFAPATTYDPAELARVAVFYSIETDRHRQTGLLTLRLDSGRVNRPPPTFSAGDVTVRRPRVTFPVTGDLTFEGERTVTCGAPGTRLTLHSVVWRTGGAGRMIVVLHAGEVRRVLFDLDDDGLVEQEVWDGDGDRRFEASRTTAFDIPAFLLPAGPPAQGPPATPDSTDAAVPLQQMPAPADSNRADTTTATPDTLRQDTLRRDTLGTDTLRQDTLGTDTLRQDTLGTDTLRRDTLGTDTLRGVRVRRDTVPSIPPCAAELAP